MTSTALRCDRIIDLIDSCLAELQAPLGAPPAAANRPALWAGAGVPAPGVRS
jgi:hypothetical protein